MDLSILIPMYNSEDFILKCLKSILNQNIPKDHYEVIIIDDGSTDLSSSLVDHYKKSHPNIIFYKQENMGAFSTRNKLLKLARGKYIYCMDADDFLAPKSLNKVLKVALNNDMDIVGFESQIIYKDDSQFNDTPGLLPSDFDIVSGTSFLSRTPDHRMEIWWYIFKRKLIETNNLIFDRNEHNADVLFTLRIFLLAKKVTYLPVSVHRYFQSENSIMRNKDRQKKILLVDNMDRMILSFSELIDKRTKDEFEDKKAILKNFKKRRDHFLFFNLLQMIRLGYGSKELAKRLNHYESFESYPIQNYIAPNKYSVIYRLINYIINRKYLLFVASNFFYLKYAWRRTSIRT